ncbi:MAG: TRAP transporter permease [Gammaproteobacteria bacterium]|nr:TRAP transporter permease [Gammaproteobacteria bacterium]
MTDTRAPSTTIAYLIATISIAFSLFQMYGAGIEPLGLFYQRSIHLSFVLVLVFLCFPLKRLPAPLAWPIDFALISLAMISGIYLTTQLDAIVDRAGFWNDTDILIGITTVLVVLEASRRVVGLGMTIIGVCAILYAFAGRRGELPELGSWLPGILEHRGVKIDRLVGQLYLGQEGIYGLPMGVAATYIFMFVLFGAFLEVTGAGKFFIELAYAATGRKVGGPAKAAVLASAGMGSISGSAIANVVTTGAFTIPLMKRLGYKPEQAGGVEAAASTGGQITPPLMGAGAFLISEYTQVPYLDIVMVSIFPAFLYLGTVYLFVHLLAHKQNMQPDPTDLPRASVVLRQGWHFLLPLGILIYLLMMNISPMRVGFFAILAVIAIDLFVQVRSQGSLVKALKINIEHTLAALQLGAKNSLAVSMACAVAGIIVGVVGLTGLGLKFSSMMMAFSGGNIILALILVLLASLVLGLGLPVTASYIVLIVLVGPALNTEFGIPLLIAHLVVFWYSQDSNVTPPVALAGFAGAAIAKASPFKTSVQAWKFAKGLYLIPAFMVFHPQIIEGGNPIELLLLGLAAIVQLLAFACALEGWFKSAIPAWQRILLGFGSAAIFVPASTIYLAATAVCIGLLCLNWGKTSIH